MPDFFEENLKILFSNKLSFLNLFLTSSFVLILGIYDDKKDYFISKLLSKGDVVLLAFGGHGFEILEEAEIIEVKQGPYDESKDKTRFENVKEDKIKIS